MAETRPQAGSKRKWSEVWNEIIARPKSPDLPSCVPIDAPSTSLYKPLPTEKHIRILTIQPASKLEDQIHCDLEVVLCTAEAQYEALSYSWAMENGDCSRNRVIHVGRRDVTITQNLFEGLRRIRHARGLVRIWVDALCINQNDVAERNSQVAQMYQIYENAQETLVWLGEDPCGRGSPVEDNNAALSAMVLMEGIRKPHEIRMLFGGSEDCICIHKGGNLCICGGFLPALAVGIDERWRDLFAAVPGLKEHTANLVKTIESFHRARYWTRRWVVQEYASEPRTLFWGDAQHAAWWDIDMKRLSSMARGVGGLHGRVAPTTHLVSGMTGLGETGLTELLAYFQTMKCSEDHDILYSLLSLSNPFELNIDYDCTFSELCYEFSKRAVAEGYWNFIFANSGVNGSRKAVEKCSDCGSSDPGSSDPEDSDQESSGSESSDSERVAPPPRFPDLNLPTWVADLRQIRYARWEPEGPPP